MFQHLNNYRLTDDNNFIAVLNKQIRGIIVKEGITFFIEEIKTH